VPSTPTFRDRNIAMEEDRLWKFRKPEWLNSAWVRNGGVYGAGALVCSYLPLPQRML
jgi:hypothetical protein